MSEKCLGKSHLLTVNVLSNLGSLQHKSGRLIEACETFQLALGYADELIPSNNPLSQYIRRYLAATLVALGRTREAEVLIGGGISGNDPA